VTRGDLQPLECELEHLDRLDAAHRAEALEGMAADPAIDLADLLVGKSRVGLGERDERAVVVAYRERVVGEQRRATSAAGLRVDEHGVDRIRVDLPFPPRPARATDTVRGVPALQHDAFAQARRPITR